MRARCAQVLLWLAALILWLGMIFLVNRRPPDAGGQALFLLLLAAAVTCTLAPLFLLIRAPRSRAAFGVRLSRALGHAALFGVLASALMTLQFLHLLNLPATLLLTTAVLMLEVLLSSRRRD